MSEEHHDRERLLRLLSVHYATGVDRRDLDLFLGVFRPDGVLTVQTGDEDAREPSLRLLGHEQLAQVIETIRRYSRTFHLLGQSMFSWSSGGAGGGTDSSAHGETYCVAHHLRPAGAEDSPRDRVMYLRYQDHYQMDDVGRWRIATRDVLVDWTESRALTSPSGWSR